VAEQSIIDAAVAYAEMGWRIVPVIDKIPIGKAWQHAATSDPGEVMAILEDSPADGVGVLLGEASCVIDIEADTPEAEAAIQAAFGGQVPRTPCYQSARGVHRLFRWRSGFPAGSGAKWMAGPIEVRGIAGKAAQSVFPPSGGRRWVVGPDAPLATLSDDVVARLVTLRQQADAAAKPKALLQRTLVVSGSSSGRLDVDAWLRRVGAEVAGHDRSPDGAERWFILCPRIGLHTTKNSLKDCCVTQEASGRMGGHCFHASCGMASWDAIRDALGQPTREEWGHADTVPSVDISGIMAQLSVPQAVEPIEVIDAEFEPAELPVDDIRTDKPAVFPDHCLEPRGLLGEIVSYTLSQSMYPQPELALACAIAIVATFAGRKVRDMRGTRTNVYVIGLEHTGGGKEAARKCAKAIMNRSASHYLGCERIGSGAGIVTAICAQPSQLMLLDEMGRMLEVTKNAAKNPAMYNAISVLMQLFSSSEGTFTADAYADASRVKSVCQPCLSFYGTSTPSKFWDSLSVDNIGEGLMGRLMAFEGRGYQLSRPTTPSSDPPQQLIDSLRWWADWQPSDNPAAVITPQPKILMHAPKALARFDAHAMAISEKRIGENLMRAAIWSRAAEKAAKLALIHACSRSITDPQSIELEDVEFGISLSNYLTRRLIAGCATSVSENEVEAAKKKVLRLIEASGEKGLTANEITRKTQWAKGRERAEILADLEAGGYIVLQSLPTRTRTKLVYRSRSYAVKPLSGVVNSSIDES
jgi:hypothetical protein